MSFIKVDECGVTKILSNEEALSAMKQTKLLPKDLLGAFIGCGCATGLACAIVVSAPVSIPTLGVVALIAGSAVAGAALGSFVPATSMIPKVEFKAPPNFHGFNLPFDNINSGPLGSGIAPTGAKIWKDIRDFKGISFPGKWENWGPGRRL